MAASRSNAVNVLREDAVREGMKRSLYTRCSLELLCSRIPAMLAQPTWRTHCRQAELQLHCQWPLHAYRSERTPASEALRRAHLERGEGKSDREREALPLPSARRRICAGDAPLAREGELYGVPASMPDDASGISVSPAHQSARPLTGASLPYLIAPSFRPRPDLAHHAAHDCLMKTHMICSTAVSMNNYRVRGRGHLSCCSLHCHAARRPAAALHLAAPQAPLFAVVVGTAESAVAYAWQRMCPWRLQLGPDTLSKPRFQPQPNV